LYKFAVDGPSAEGGRFPPNDPPGGGASLGNATDPVNADSARDQMFSEFMVNNATVTDINGNAVNPVAASLVANNVAPTKAGLTQSAAQVIASSPTMNSGTVTKNDNMLSSSAPLSVNQFSADQGSSNLNEITPNPFSADQSSSVTPQNLDTSGGSSTGNNE
jgi:hypothetical protein